MSTSSSHSSPRQEDSSDLVRAARPIMGPEAALIEEEARQRAGEIGQEVMGERRRGRVEAEAHRISEELTRRAQEQRRATEHPHVPPVRIEAGDSLTRLFRPPASITRVLVPLSGTPFAERAIPYAVALARLTGASLSLVHVGDSSGSEPAAALERALTTLQEDAQPNAAPVAMAHALSPTFGHLWEHVASHLAGVEWHNLPEGPLAQSLLALEAPDGSDLVVLATHRHHGAEGDTLDTVVRMLIRHGKTPILVIPPDVIVSEQELPEFRRILVPLDGSALAEQALAPLITMLRGRPDAMPGSAAGTGLHEIVLFSAAEARQTLDDAHFYLNDLCGLLQSNLPANLRFSIEARLGSAPGAIVATAEHGGEAMRERPTPFDLVALATHGRGGLRRWLLGSVAEYVLTHAKGPVLVVRPTLLAQVED